MSDIVERIEQILIRERLFREDFERRLKDELREEMWTLLLRLPSVVDGRAKVMIHTKDNHRLLLDMNETFMAYHLIENGAWEEPIRHLISHLLRPGGVYFDIGANIGVHALLGAARVGAGGLVVAVEPAPEVFARLRENLEINNLVHLCRLYNCAVSDRSDETATFEVFPQHPAMSAFKISEDRGEQLQCTPERITVQTKTIDALVAESGKTPDLIKMDIEGFELVAMRGAEKALRVPTTAWLIEHNPVMARELLGEDATLALWRLIDGAGLRAYRVRESAEPGALDEDGFVNSPGCDLLLMHAGSDAETKLFG